MVNRMSFSKVFTELLNDYEVSVSELARKTGIGQTTLSNYKNSPTVQPSWENVQKIAAALGISTDELRQKPEGAVSEKQRLQVVITDGDGNQSVVWEAWVSGKVVTKK
jgi:transcriptional regulator with XRE-family HTH domain